jgi:hypothetical protein
MTMAGRDEMESETALTTSLGVMNFDEGPLLQLPDTDSRLSGSRRHVRASRLPRSAE